MGARRTAQFNHFTVLRYVKIYERYMKIYEDI